MLGSAILKRWLVSLALVGLVSLFMASFAPDWVSPASAPTATGPAGQILSNLLTGTDSLNLQAGQVVGLSASPVDDTGTVNQNMPDIVYTWSAGSCGTLSSSSIQSPVFTASASSCSGQVGVHAKQHGAAQVPGSDLIISISVVAPQAAAAATAVPVVGTVAPVSADICPGLVKNRDTNVAMIKKAAPMCMLDGFRDRIFGCTLTRRFPIWSHSRSDKSSLV